MLPCVPCCQLMAFSTLLFSVSTLLSALLVRLEQHQKLRGFLFSSSSPTMQVALQMPHGPTLLRSPTPQRVVSIARFQTT
jgi:hypothetical protein